MPLRSQRTLIRPVILEGVGVHSGEACRAVCRPAAPNEGLVFERTDLPNRPKWVVSESSDPAQAGDHRSLIGDASQGIATTEHFLAGLWGLGISNLRIEINAAEFPILDGSASEYMTRLSDGGLVTQEFERPVLTVTEPAWVSRGTAAILALPGEGFGLSYTLDLRAAGIEAQHFVWEHGDLDDFESEVAGARTFCTAAEAQALRKMGLGRGANYENTLVLAPEGPVEGKLRYRDEAARHKALDLIADLTLGVWDVRGRVFALRSGHALNHELRRTLLSLRKNS